MSRNTFLSGGLADAARQMRQGREGDESAASNAEDLRHTYASILINKGVSLYEIQRLLGHHHITMTERYAHLLPNTLKNKVDLISDFIE